MHKIRSTTYLCFVPAVFYSALVFYIAPLLPALTNKAAAALTWVVYARMVKTAMSALAAVLAAVLIVRWFSLRRKGLFLALTIAYAAAVIPFVARLGNSVNEYVHFPEYALPVLLWYAALRRLEADRRAVPPGADRAPGLRTWQLAAAVCGVMGILDECYQGYLPQRYFGIQDILLNFMGVWLGVLLLWAFRGTLRDDKLAAVQKDTV